MATVTNTFFTCDDLEYINNFDKVEPSQPRIMLLVKNPKLVSVHGCIFKLIIKRIIKTMTDKLILVNFTAWLDC